MSRPLALLAVVLIWAAIFLPGLGSTELKGEEGRRIMPGVEMIESGDWLVPHFHGEPYLRKPPLVNWAIAFSIEACGVRNEWAARLPSVLAVLALVLTTFLVMEKWRGTTAGVITTVLVMTNLGLLEKGRLAEIEAIYISLTGLAIVCWLAWWAREKSPWLTWTVPFVFLGLGLLAKGPVHLLFFYALVVPILWKAGRWRDLFRLPHLAGLALMVALFAAWAVPYFHATAHLDAAGVWQKQMEERVGGGHFDFKAWLINFPRALGNYLPWLLFLPLLWHRATLACLPERDALIVRAARGPLVICFFGLMLIPGMLPRYTLPMLVPASVLLALVLPVRFGVRPVRWALAAGGLAGGAMIFYAWLIIPHVNARDDLRPFAAQLNASIPAGQTLAVLDPGLAPALFYVRAHCVYYSDYRALPPEVDYLFARPGALHKLQQNWHSVRVLTELRDKDQNRFYVLQLRDKV